MKEATKLQFGGKVKLEEQELNQIELDLRFNQKTT
jgi:hypothetical protein